MDFSLEIDCSLPDLEFTNKFQQLLSKIIDYEERNVDPSLKKPIRQQYSLLEDLMIWNNNASHRKFDDLKNSSKILKYRTTESLRSRNKDYIGKLEVNDLKTIASTLQKNYKECIKAYLIFKNHKFTSIEKSLQANNMRKSQGKIRMAGKDDDFFSDLDEKENKINNKIDAKDNAAQLEENNKKSVHKSTLDENETNLSLLELGSNNDSSIKKEKTPPQELIRPSSKKLKDPSDFNCHHFKILFDYNEILFPEMQTINKEKDPIIEVEKSKIVLMKDFSSKVRMITKEEDDINTIENFFDRMKNNFNKERDEVIKNLTKLSGNFNDLIEYYTDPEKYEHLLWNEEEDEILRKNTNKEDSFYKLIVRYKGCQKIEERMRFLKIN